MKMLDVLTDVRRCPQCGTANPTLKQTWRSDCIVPRGESGYGINWATYLCTSCRKMVLARSRLGNADTCDVELTYPHVDTVDSTLPERAAKYLTQAVECIHAPDGAVMLCGSAVDAMLKEKGLTNGSLYDRIDNAVAGSLITKEMGDWAHEVRLGSNRPRHADQNDPHTTENQAALAVEFVKALGHFLFVLPARVQAGRAKAQSTP